MRTALTVLLAASLWVSVGAAQPMIDFSAPAPLGLLSGAHTDIGDVHVGGLYWDGQTWRSHGAGARLYRFDRIDWRADGTVKTAYHGLGFCAPADLRPGRTCGQFDQRHQEEIARIVRPDGWAITAIWLSEIVGNDQVDVWGSDSLTFDPARIVWVARAVAGEGPFQGGVPCVGVPTEAPRRCDGIEGPIVIPVAHQQWRVFFLRGVPGAHRAFVLWGVDVTENEW